MTNILAIDTSSDICSVSLGKGKEIFDFHKSLPKQHTENLLNVISDLLSQSELNYVDLQAVAVGVGPGSYTGIRLACAVAQGIAFSHNIKGLTLSSLELIAIQAFHKTKSSNIVAISDLNLEKLYISESKFSDGDIDSTFRAISQEEFKQEDFDENSLFVGPGCSLFPEITNKLEGILPKASNLVEIARMRFKNDLLSDPEDFLPIYLNDEDSWKKIK